MSVPVSHTELPGISRREFLKASAIGGGLALSGFSLFHWLQGSPLTAQTFIGKSSNYEGELAGLIREGLTELGISATAVKGKRILLKPNLVEPHKFSAHINTHPLVVRGAVEAFLSLGAATIVVAEGPGHRHDTLLVLEDSGLADVLHEDQIPFQDLNTLDGWTVPNIGGYTDLATLTFPRLFQEIDWIVSMAKMKTHHWTGATLSMKNMFGVMPGIYYGWPKNVLHRQGIVESILDINASLKPHFAIIDGITGMEGDGPIMGTPIDSGVIVMGGNFPAVDATCCRIMGIDPYRLSYLEEADQWLGPIRDSLIEQRGETWRSVRTSFKLIPEIPAHQNIRLS